MARGLESLVVFVLLLTVLGRGGWQGSHADVDCGDVSARVGEPVPLDASCLLQAEPAASLFRWDFDGDGTWDTNWTGDVVVEHTWDSPFVGPIYVEGAPVVSDAVQVAVERQPPSYFGVLPREPRLAQSFVVYEPVLTAVELRAFINWGSPAANFVLSLRDELDGEDFTSTSVPPGEIPSGIKAVNDPDAWTTFDFADYVVSPGNTYYLLMHQPEPQPPKGGIGFFDEKDMYPEGAAYYKLYGDFEMKDWDLQMRIHTAFLGDAVRGKFSVTVEGALELDASVPARVVEGSPANYEATAVYYGAGDLTFTWDFGFGQIVEEVVENPGSSSPFVASSEVFFTFGDDCLCTVTLTVRDGYGATVTHTTTVEVVNVPPTLDAEIRAFATGDLCMELDDADEGVAVTLGVFDGTATRELTLVGPADDDGDENDDDHEDDEDEGIWGCLKNVTIEVTVGSGSYVRVTYDPTNYVSDDHDDDDEDEEDDEPEAEVELYWGPPSDDDDEFAELEFEGPDIQVVDVPPRVLLTPGEAEWEHGVWEFEDEECGDDDEGGEDEDECAIPAITFEATASDPGSDDLTFTWSWGDGTADTVSAYYNDGMGPDPVSSPEVNPIIVTDAVKHRFSGPGTYVVAVTVEDDDGGTAVASVTLSL